MARRYEPPPPIPTLAELRQNYTWVWVYCEGNDCHHGAPMAYTPAIIRWGPDASSDMLRTRVRCTKCGRKGATLRTPSYDHFGLYPFPTAPKVPA